MPLRPSAAFCHSVAASAKQTAARSASVATKPFIKAAWHDPRRARSEEVDDVGTGGDTTADRV
jgi:hypothetical protein